MPARGVTRSVRDFLLVLTRAFHPYRMPPRVDNLRESTHRAVRLVALGHLADAAMARDRLATAADSEALHDFRVALRRLRSWERAFRPYMRGDVSKKLRRRLRELARDTGASRDLEVHLAWLAEQRGTLRRRERPGLRWLLATLDQRKSEADTLLERDVDARFGRLRGKLERALMSYREELRLADNGRASAPAPFAAALAPRVREATSELRDHLARIHSPRDEHEAHEARIAAKRARYLLEPISRGVPEAGELVEHLKSLQDVLGDLHDAQLFGAEIEALAADADHSEASADGERRADEAGAVVVPAPDVASPNAPPAADAAASPDQPPGTEAPVADAAQPVTTGDAERGTLPNAPRPVPDILPGVAAIGARLRARASAAFEQFAGGWIGDAGAAFCREVEAVADRIAQAASEGIEIERKYLLRFLPEEARAGRRVDIEQGYVPGEQLQERVRRVAVRHARGRTEVRYYRTIKLGTGMARMEIEEQTTAEIFDALWPLTEGRRLRKRRYTIEEDGRAWEIDEFRNRDLVLAEIELDDESAEVRFPDWLARAVEREVTGEDAYQNINLAR